MGFGIFQVDAFTDRAFAGNPAAVCILTSPRDEVWMQKMAQEMNLSETAFLSRQEDMFALRWFTPAVEVDLCGHATLASAHILWETGMLGKHEQARFQTRSGLLTAELRGDWIELNFPSTPDQQAVPPVQLGEALGVAPKYVGKSRFDYLLVVDTENIVRDLKPNFGLLKTLGVRGVMVTSKASLSGYDFVSRFFAPGAGIDEDPVTGSAHCCLGPYWSRQLNKNSLVGYQASRRGGTVRIRVEGDRVYLSGQATTVFRGELTNSL